MKRKKIVLKPTDFILDVFDLEDKKLEEKDFETFHHMFGASKAYYEENLIPNSVQWVESDKESKRKGQRCIQMILEKRSPEIVVHESVHVAFYLNTLTKVEINWDSQEWVAIFIEDIFGQVMSNKGWKNC